MRYSFLVWLLVLCSCASSQKPAAPDPAHVTEVEPVWIEDKFTPAERATVEQALAEWNFALNGYLQFRIEDEKYQRDDLMVYEQVKHTHQGTIIMKDALLDAMMSGLPLGILGWTDDDRVGVHLVVEAIGTRDLKLVALHELGHSLGLMQHAMAKDTLMSSPHENMCGCIDVYTLQTLAGLRRWDWRRMRGCSHPQ